MKFKKTKIDGLMLVEIDKFDDERGFLAKFYDSEDFPKDKIEFKLTQVKFTFTRKKGTIRGMHMQSKPFEEDKIVHCIKGKIYEVVIDMRRNSKTYGKWFGAEFSENQKMCLYIPKGFAHGYQTLTQDCEVLYLMSGKFSKKNNIGFRWDDKFFNIGWPLKPTVILEKDRTWPLIES